MGFFDKLKSGLKKTKDSFLGKVDTILAGFGKIDEELFEELEDVLISSDFGVQTTEEILKKLREFVKSRRGHYRQSARIFCKGVVRWKEHGRLYSTAWSAAA